MGRIAKTSVQPDLNGFDLVTFSIHDGEDLDTAPIYIRLETRLDGAVDARIRDITLEALLRGRDLLDAELARLTPAFDVFQPATPPDQQMDPSK